MPRRAPEAWSALDLVEAFHLAHAISALYELNAIASLRRPITVDRLARQTGLDPALLSGTLEYLAARTNLIAKKGARFNVTSDLSTHARFLFELYAGAYRNHATRLAELLQRPALAASLLDNVRYARALDGVDDSWPRTLAALMRQLDLDRVLDLGCGTAGLLTQLAIERPSFVGWGLERNRAACKAARARLREANLKTRVRIYEGDISDLRAALPRNVLDDVRVVVASQVANEMFHAGPARFVAWLRRLRQTLPGRLLLLSDYYGRLGARGGDRETLLHDYVQVISGQGVPPAKRSDWRKNYEAAGCRLMHVIEDTGTTRFIHFIKLR